MTDTADPGLPRGRAALRRHLRAHRRQQQHRLWQLGARPRSRGARRHPHDWFGHRRDPQHLRQQPGRRLRDRAHHAGIHDRPAQPRHRPRPAPAVLRRVDRRLPAAVSAADQPERRLRAPRLQGPAGLRRDQRHLRRRRVRGLQGREPERDLPRHQRHAGTSRSTTASRSRSRSAARSCRSSAATSGSGPSWPARGNRTTTRRTSSPDAFDSNHAIGTPRRAPSNSLPPGGADVFGNTAWQDHTFRFSLVYNLPWAAGAHYVFQSPLKVNHWNFYPEKNGVQYYPSQGSKSNKLTFVVRVNKGNSIKANLESKFAGTDFLEIKL